MHSRFEHLRPFGSACPYPSQSLTNSNILFYLRVWLLFIVMPSIHSRSSSCRQYARVPCHWLINAFSASFHLHAYCAARCSVFVKAAQTPKQILVPRRFHLLQCRRMIYNGALRWKVLQTGSLLVCGTAAPRYFIQLQRTQKRRIE